MSEITTYQQLDVRELDCQKLASIAGNDYYEVRQIVRDDGQKRVIVGRASDWPIISRDARIAELEQRVKDLEHLIITESAAPPEAPPSDGKVTCEVCGQRLKPRGLLNHKRMAHGQRIQATPPAPTLHLLDDDPTWRCAEVGCSGAFTRSLTSPDYCAKHAPATNGHLVAA